MANQLTKYILWGIVGLLLGILMSGTVFQNPAHAYSGGFSGGSVHVSVPSYHYSPPPVHVSAPSYSGGSVSHSSGSFTGGTKSVAPVRLPTPVHSVAATAPKPIVLPQTAGPTPAPPVTTVVHEYSYNPFNGNFFFWYWMFGGFNHAPEHNGYQNITVYKNSTTTAQQATSTSVSGK